MKLKHATRLELFIGSIKNHDFFVIFGVVQNDERSIIFRLHIIVIFISKELNLFKNMKMETIMNLKTKII